MNGAMPPWPGPVHLGQRLCWFDGERNQTIPVVKVEPFWTAPERQDTNEWGYIAELPTENGATVSLAYDPTNVTPADPRPTAMFLNVRHPQTDALIAAEVDDGAIVYDPQCEGAHCRGCYHGSPGWCEVVSSAEEVMRHLARLGSMPIRAVAS